MNVRQAHCDVAECGGKHWAKGYCQFHYGRLRKFGDVHSSGSKRGKGSTSARDAAGLKQCIGCDGWLEESEFYDSGFHTADGLSSRCVSCVALARRVRRYGVSLTWFDDTVVAQGGVCAICRESDVRGPKGCVDHDHGCCDGDYSCGKCVRGVLCRVCNLMIGYARDSESVLYGAVSYLRGFA